MCHTCFSAVAHPHTTQSSGGLLQAKSRCAGDGKAPSTRQTDVEASLPLAHPRSHCEELSCKNSSHLLCVTSKSVKDT